MLRGAQRKWRMLARLAVCLALGAILTVMVAWACVWRSRLQSGWFWPETTFLAGEAWWGVTTRRAFGIRRVESGYLSSKRDNPTLGVPSLLVPRPPQVEASAAVIDSSMRRTAEGTRRQMYPGLDADGLEQRLRSERYADESAGWPFLALRHECRVAETSVGPIIQQLSGGFELPWTLLPTGGSIRPARMLNSDRLIALPLRPAWPGLLADTALYGAIAYGMLFGPGAIRRAARRRAGCCQDCGYRLVPGGPPGCPECGLGRPPGVPPHA